MPSVVTNGDRPRMAMHMPLTRPTSTDTTRPASTDTTRIRPGTLATTVLPSAARCTNSDDSGAPGVDSVVITIEVIIAAKHISEPTDRSMPPVMITKVMPSVEIGRAHV